MIKVRLHDLTFEPYLSEVEIRDRVNEIGVQLKVKYGKEAPVFLGMLSGAFIFMADLIRAFDAPCETAFVKYHSYKGTKTTGQLTERLGVDDSLEGKTVIIVEDIIDSGTTMTTFLPVVLEKKPAKVVVVTLLYKPDAVVYPVNIDYTGFEIDDVFVVGYGLDYEGLGRNLKEIFRLTE